MMNEFLGLMLDPFVNGAAAAGRLQRRVIGFAPDAGGDVSRPMIALAYDAVLKAPPKPAIVRATLDRVRGACVRRQQYTPTAIRSSAQTISPRTTFGFAGGMDYRL